MGRCMQILNDVKQCPYLGDMNFVIKAMTDGKMTIQTTAVQEDGTGVVMGRSRAYHEEDGS